VLSTKIAPRAFGGVNSPDPLCARHALAVAALAARDMPGMYVEQMGQLVSNSLEIWRTTGKCSCVGIFEACGSVGTLSLIACENPVRAQPKPVMSAIYTSIHVHLLDTAASTNSQLPLLSLLG
jgi:hypothetical protein